MENKMQVFSFEGNQMRVVMKDGQPWWFAKDICAILGIVNVGDALSGLDDDEKSVVDPNIVIADVGFDQMMNAAGMDIHAVIPEAGRGGRPLSLVNEPGLYSLILRSRRPEARAFKRWVTHEVLPAINRHGVYMTPTKIEEVLSDPDTIIKIAQALKEERAKRLELEAQAEANRPKVLFADSVECSNDSIYVNELAKLLKQNGVDIGEKRLFAWLREHGYLMRYNTGNIPTQKAMDAKLFTIRETEKTTPDGKVRLFRTPMVTGRGQRYFINSFLNEQAGANEW